MKKLNSFLQQIKNLWPRPWPSRKQWACLPQVVSIKERWLVSGLLLLIILGLAFLAINDYLNQTIAQPKIGGEYKEGMLGQPRYINPTLSQTNDIDRDLAQLIYSGLFKYDGNGNLINDLAEKYEIKKQGLLYQIWLKKNALWHDNQPLTADDVVFTIKTVQNPEYRSPLRASWQGVEVERVDDWTVNFKLKNIYEPFLHNLTIGILPKHRWAGISAQNFPLAEYNLQPIGSGPFKFKKINQEKTGGIESLELERNENFYLQPPFIEKIIFQFFNQSQEVINAYNRGEIDGFNSILASERDQISNGLNVHQIGLPVYFAVFFNQTQSQVLADKTVRLALAYATNKQEIIDKVFNGQAIPLDSPLLPGWPGYSSQTKIYDFALEHAKNILEEAGWKDNNNDGIREKEIKKEKTDLIITLKTTDWPELTQAADLIKAQWEQLGAKINIETINALSIQEDAIRPRQYEALLFGEVLAADPDPFAFWHSSQKKDPGLNLSLYQNKEVDKLLEEIRQTLDQSSRQEKYLKFQQLLSEDLPAIFLYSPNYLYPVNQKVKGINLTKLALPSYRFCQVEEWYIETKRVTRNQ